MIDTAALKGIIVARGFSQSSVAKALGVTPKTFYTKMKKGKFNSDEMYRMVQLLKIESPCDIFLAKNVT